MSAEPFGLQIQLGQNPTLRFYAAGGKFNEKRGKERGFIGNVAGGSVGRVGTENGGDAFGTDGNKRKRAAKQCNAENAFEFAVYVHRCFAWYRC